MLLPSALFQFLCTAFERLGGFVERRVALGKLVVRGRQLFRLQARVGQLLPGGFDQLAAFGDAALTRAQYSLGGNRLVRNELADRVECLPGFRQLAGFLQRDAMVITQKRDALRVLLQTWFMLLPGGGECVGGLLRLVLFAKQRRHRHDRERSD